MFVMTKYSHHSTAGFGEQVGKKKGEILWIKNALPEYFYLLLLGFYWLSALQCARGDTLV